MALVREGNTASVTRNTHATAHGNIPIRFNKSNGLSIVVRSLSISTVASAGIRTADSFGVIRFKNKNMARVIPVNRAELAKKIPAAIIGEEAVDTEIMEVKEGKKHDNSCRAINT